MKTMILRFSPLWALFTFTRLADELTQAGITVMSKDEVRAIKHEMVKNRIPVLGHLCMVATNGYLTLLTMTMLAVVGFWTGFLLTGGLLASMTGATWLLLQWSHHAGNRHAEQGGSGIFRYSDDIARKIGIQWRTASVIFEKDHRGAYQFRGNNFHPEAIPTEATRIRDATRHRQGSADRIHPERSVRPGHPLVAVRQRGRLRLPLVAQAMREKRKRADSLEHPPFSYAS